MMLNQIYMRTVAHRGTRDYADWSVRWIIARISGNPEANQEFLTDVLHRFTSRIHRLVGL
jgi:hypothetical protein